MKVPLVYPKIPDTKNCPLKNCIAFDKIDGTCLHFVLEKSVWKSFGTRRDEFNLTSDGEAQFNSAHPELAGASKLWDSKFELGQFLWCKAKYQYANKIIVFAEYVGANSFAGQHKQDDPMQFVIFDIQVDGKMLSPEVLLEDFKNFNLPKVIYKGKYSGQLVEDIRNGKYKVNEGSVIKGEVDGKVYMAKVKTNEYLKRLKFEFKDNWKDYWE